MWPLSSLKVASRRLYLRSLTTPSGLTSRPPK
ncbi:hypothetical protein KEN49_CDS0335 [Pseudomonas phage vB_Pae3705-KEN49]